MNDQNAILLGYEIDDDSPPVGFGRQGVPSSAGRPIYHDMETPLMTIAPTGAGKGVSCIIPTLLRLNQPAIVIDPKGEAFQVTAAHRQRMGHQVVCIDPFLYTGKHMYRLSGQANQPFLPHATATSTDTYAHMYRGGLNPLDLLRVGSPSVVDDATSLTAALAPHRTFGHDPFWDLKAQQILTGFVLAIAAFAPKRHRHLGTLKRLLSAAPSEISAILRAMLASDLFNGWMADSAKQLMSMPDKTVNSVMATATYMINIYGTKQVIAALGRTTFSFDDLIEGKDLTIYIVLPPDKLASHAALLRLWLSTLVRLMFKRRTAPIKPCLVLIDEAAQLGSLDDIRTMVTLMRGYGLMPWMFFQSLSQLQRLYPDWRTFAENCGTIQVFGFNSQFGVEQALNLTGFSGVALLLGSSRDTQIIAQANKKPRLARLRSYLTSADLRSIADVNTLAATFHKGISHEKP